MKKFLILIAFSLGVIFLYHLYPIRLLSIDLSARITASLFNTFHKERYPDEEIIILNTGNLSSEEIKTHVDSILNYKPRLVGIGICPANPAPIDAYRNHPNVVLADCSIPAGTLAREVLEGNLVTHFRTDNPAHFELQLAAHEKPQSFSHDRERINYYGSFGSFWHIDLTNLDQTDLTIFTEKTVLLGYCGDFVSGMEAYTDNPQDELMRGYQEARITPMNASFGDEATAPDMYDIQIAANIVKMIREDNFFTECGLIVRVLFMLICMLLLTGIISVIQTRGLFLNLIIYMVCYLVFVMAGTFLVVYLFSNNIYLEVPELSIVLLLASGFTVLYNQLSAKRKKENNLS